MGFLFGGGQSISQSEPALGALRVQTSSFGMAVPLVYGTNRVSGNLIWYGDFTAIPHTSTQSAGGKGGGGATYSNTTYTYKVATAIALCEGPIAGIGALWQGKSKIANPATQLGFSVFTGGYAQSPWGHLSTNHPGEALNYRGTAYIANASYDLGSSASLPNHNIEVKGQFIYSGSNDANPKDVLVDFLTHAKYGVGFPSAKIDALTTFDAYCRAYGLFMSPAWTQQRPAHEMIAEILGALSVEPFWSEGKIKLAPYADESRTANGATYTPNLTPLYDLTDDDFLYEPGQDPVRCTRKTPADMYNQVQVEFNNRANDYNVEPVEAKDQANIELFGLRPMKVEKAAFICEKTVAQQVVQMKLQRALYIRNSYEFKLGWRYSRLEPMDLVTLTDAGLHLDKAPVLITEVEEDEDGSLLVRAEEYPYGVNSGAQYPKQGSSGYITDYNIAPGNVNAPLIFEPPMALSQAPEVWMALSGGANWGGCEVWISTDNASYARVGTVYGGARMGVLSASLPAAGGNPDIINTLSVNLSQSRGQLLSGTQQDATGLVTLCYVDGELMAYQTATLTAQYAYNLTYLVRAAYATVNAVHNSGTKFARLDQGIVKYAYTPDQIGKTIYLKFLSFNAYNGGLQELGDVSAYTYTISGAPVGQVTGLALEQPFTGTSLKAKWTPVSQASSYTVEVWANSGLRRTVTGISQPRFEYSSEDAVADGGPWRTITVKVKAVTLNGSSTSFAELVASNPAPAAPSGLSATGGPNNITIKATKPTDTDYTGTLIYMSATSGFTPGPLNLVYDGPDLQVTIAGLSQVPYYFRVAHYDSFGQESLNLSTEISATPISITGTIGVVASLPGVGDYEGQVVYLSSNDKLYRWDGTAWTAAVDGADILANSVTAQKLSVAQLSAIAASLGSITSGNITLDSASSIKGGQTAYDTGTGFFLGYSGTAYKFSFGNSAGQKITWDGSQLSIGGVLSAVTGSFGNINADGSVTVGTSGNVKGGQTAYDTGTGFFLGYSGGAYKFSIGNSAGNKITWDGTNLLINGAVPGQALQTQQAYTAAWTKTTTESYETVQSVAITVGAAANKVVVHASLVLAANNKRIRLVRDSTVLDEQPNTGLIDSLTFVFGTTVIQASLDFTDYPGAGAHTYYLQVLSTNGASFPVYSSSRLVQAHEYRV